MENLKNKVSSSRSVIAKGVIFTTGAMVLTNITIMASAFLTFNIITSKQLGQVSLALSIFVFSSYFMDFGLGRVFSSEIAKKRAVGAHGKVRYYIGMLFKIQAISAVSLFTIIAIAHRPIAGLINIPSHYMFAVMIYFVLFSIRVFYIMIFNSHLLYFWQNMLDLSANIFRCGLLVYAMTTHPKNPIQFILYSYPISMAFALVIVTPALFVFVLWPLRSVRTENDINTRTSLWNQAKFGLLYNPLKSVVDGAPVWLLRFLTHNFATVGIFHCTMQLVRASYAVVRATETTLQPLISQYQAESPEKRQLFMNRISKYSLWFVSITVLIIWPSIPYLLRLVKPEYMIAVPYFRLGIFSIFAMVFMQVQRPLLIAIEHMDILILANIMQIFVIFLFGVLLIPLIGIWGLIAADLSTSYLCVALYHIFIKKYVPGYKLLINPFLFDDSDRSNFRYLLSFGRNRG